MQAFRLAARKPILAAALILSAGRLGFGLQAPADPPSSALAATNDSQPHSERPLPDIPELMREVEANQRRSEAIEKTYLYHSVETQREQQSGGREKVTSTESEHFWMNGVPVRRVLRRNGKDLSADETAKEEKRVEKQAREGRERRDKMQAEGKQSDPQGHEEITVSRLLELGAFSNPRRVNLRGRSTVAVDYTGDPHAKTRNRAEEVIRDMAGTAWVDEEDKVLVQAEGRFVRPFKIGAGLIADIRQDTQFSFQQTKVNSEVWLPSRISAQGAARAMLFFAFSGRIDVVDSDYRKFRATTTLLPDFAPINGAPSQQSPGQPEPNPQ